MTGQHPGFSPPRLHVKVGTRDGARRDLYFERSFRIGRQEGCEVCIPDEYVSRLHAEVILDQGQWWESAAVRIRFRQSAGAPREAIRAPAHCIINALSGEEPKLQAAWKCPICSGEMVLIERLNAQEIQWRSIMQESTIDSS